MVSIGYSNLTDEVLCNKHTNNILNYCKQKPAGDILNYTTLNTNIKNHFSGYNNGKIDTLEKLLSISIEDIHGLKDYFDQLPALQKEKINGIKESKKKGIQGVAGKINLEGLYTVFTASKESFSSNELAQKSDIKTCPYCNENHIYHFAKSQRVFDWDHIYPKSKYPFLAVSFYNLVPCCKVCNFFKKAKSDPFFNPHSKLNVDDIYKFSYKRGISPSDLKISLTFLPNIDSNLKPKFENTFNATKFKERVKEHKELLKQIIEQKEKEKEFKEKLRQFEKQNLFSQGQFDSYINSTWHFEKDYKYYYKKPFSKFIKDIISQIDSTKI